MGSWSKISYPRRLFLWLLGYSLLMVGCFVIFQYHREREFKEEEINARLQLINAYIVTELAEGVPMSEIELHDLHPIDNLRVSLISPGGRIVYDNTLDSIPGASHLGRQEVTQALAHGSGYAVRRQSATDGNYYFYSATRTPGGAVVRTALPYSVSLSSFLEADYGFLWVMGTIALMMCMLGYFATRRVGQHILRLKLFAENVENGHIVTDTEPFPHDELGDISNHIVRLYARLQKANTDRDKEHRAALHEHLEKERIKKQLTNNINHELKTPVASIRISVESLLAHEEMSPDKRRKFLERCLTNTERLQRLLADVSLITRLDDGATSIAREPVDLARIIETVADDRRLMASEAGIAIDNAVTGPLPLNGNIPLLEAMFNNLIDNAIAYSGGSRISIAAEPAGDNGYIITVADDGTGVAPEHLPRLFERFYRIDKGRSRAAGGTGLGLAIVKNAVLFHGGVITAENRSEGGLMFRIHFPAG